MTIDIRLLALMISVASLLQALVIVVCATQAPHLRGLRLLAWGGVAQAVGFGLLLLRDLISDALSIVLANTLLVVSVLLVLRGINQFFGHARPLQGVLAGALAVATLLAYVPLTYITPDITARTVVISLSLMLLNFCCVWSLVNLPEKPLRVWRWFGAMVFAINGAWLGLRALITALGPPLQVLFTPTRVQVISFTLPSIVAVLWAVTLVAMIVQRRVEQPGVPTPTSAA
jgi:hypothetical protein